MSVSAKVGQSLQTQVDPRRNNGQDVAAAVVTAVKENADGETRVNLVVFLDTGATERRTDVEVRAKQPDEDKADDVKADASGVKFLAWRV